MSNYRNGNPHKIEYACLYTTQKTQKRKRWMDGKLVLQPATSRASLFPAAAAAGSSLEPLDSVDILPPHMDALRTGNVVELEFEKYLIEVQGPWNVNNSNNSNNNTNNNMSVRRNPLMPRNVAPSQGMQKLMSRKFRIPASNYVPKHPSERVEKQNQVMMNRKRPLQPGELERKYYGDSSSVVDNQYYDASNEWSHPNKNYNYLQTGSSSQGGSSTFDFHHENPPPSPNPQENYSSSRSIDNSRVVRSQLMAVQNNAENLMRASAQFDQQRNLQSLDSNNIDRNQRCKNNYEIDNSNISNNHRRMQPQEQSRRLAPSRSNNYSFKVSFVPEGADYDVNEFYNEEGEENSDENDDSFDESKNDFLSNTTTANGENVTKDNNENAGLNKSTREPSQLSSSSGKDPLSKNALIELFGAAPPRNNFEDNKTTNNDDTAQDICSLRVTANTNTNKSEKSNNNSLLNLFGASSTTWKSDNDATASYNNDRSTMIYASSFDSHDSSYPSANNKLSDSNITAAGLQFWAGAFDEEPAATKISKKPSDAGPSLQIPDKFESSSDDEDDSNFGEK